MLQAVIIVKIHFRYRHIIQRISPRKTEFYFIRPDRLRQFHHIIFSAVGIRSLHNGHIFRICSVRMFFIEIADRYLGIRGNIFRFRKGNITHLIIIIQRKQNPFIVCHIFRSVIPVQNLIIRTEIFIHRSKSALAVLIQGACYHLAPAVGRAHDMGAYFPLPVGFIDQFIFRHLGRLQRNRPYFRMKGRPALAQRIHSCHIYLISRLVFQAGNGVLVLFDARNCLE